MNAEELAARQRALLTRLDALDDRLQAHCTSTKIANDDSNSRLKASQTEGTSTLSNPVEGGLNVEERLTALLRAGGVSKFEFKRVSEGYYDSPLESRQQELRAASVDHLCKSIVMVRTQIVGTSRLQVASMVLQLSSVETIHPPSPCGTSQGLLADRPAFLCHSPSLYNLLHDADKHASSGRNYRLQQSFEFQVLCCGHSGENAGSMILWFLCTTQCVASRLATMLVVSPLMNQ